MDTLLENGQHACAVSGLPIPVTGDDLIIQQAFIRLCIPQGSFPYDTQLGSRLHLLKNHAAATDREALAMIQQALRPMPAVRAADARCHFPQPGNLAITATLVIDQQTKTLEVTL